MPLNLVIQTRLNEINLLIENNRYIHALELIQDIAQSSKALIPQEAFRTIVHALVQDILPEYMRCGFYPLANALCTRVKMLNPNGNLCDKTDFQAIHACMQLIEAITKVKNAIETGIYTGDGVAVAVTFLQHVYLKQPYINTLLTMYHDLVETKEGTYLLLAQEALNTQRYSDASSYARLAGLSNPQAFDIHARAQRQLP